MTPTPIDNPESPFRSPFVTGVGRAFAALYGIATLGILGAIAELGAAPAVPNLRWLLATALVVDAGGLIAAVGLLRRRPWARRAFIAALCVSFLQAAVYGRLTRAFAVISWAFLPALVGSALLYGWVIFKLCSAPVRAEFAVSRGSAE